MRHSPLQGGIGAAIGGATCELERERGFASKEWIVAYTRDAELKITGEHGQDKYERRVIDLRVNGKDIGHAGIYSRGLIRGAGPWLRSRIGVPQTIALTLNASMYCSGAALNIKVG